MAVILIRIDDRLVHGQVVEGWLRSIRASHIVVANDGVAADETQMALYRLAIPSGISLSCLTIQQAAQQWVSPEWAEKRVLVLISTPRDAVSLMNAGAEIRSVNVGGMHYRPGRVEVLKAVSVDEQDLRAFKTLADRGVILEARPLPLDEPIALIPYLETWRRDHGTFNDQAR